MKAVTSVRLGAVALVISTFPAAAGAQVQPVVPQDTFGKLPDKVRIGDTVIVTDRGGQNIPGRITSVSEKSISLTTTEVTLDPDGRTVQRVANLSYAAGEVNRIRRPEPVWDGALKGAMVGAVVPVVIISVDRCHSLNANIGPYLLGAAMGAGIGALVDGAIGPKTVYDGRRRPRTVSIAPIAGDGWRGVQALLSFGGSRR
jgi:hypothetical protein